MVVDLHIRDLRLFSYLPDLHGDAVREWCSGVRNSDPNSVTDAVAVSSSIGTRVYELSLVAPVRPGAIFSMNEHDEAMLPCIFNYLHASPQKLCSVNSWPLGTVVNVGDRI